MSAAVAAPAADEYDDDYDDQWDDGGFGAVTTDTGLYDNDDDYTAIKTYNRVYRELEAEDEFWQESCNTNHMSTTAAAASSSSNTGKKSYRGPDKMRGGRIIHSFGRGSGRGSDIGLIYGIQTKQTNILKESWVSINAVFI